MFLAIGCSSVPTGGGGGGHRGLMGRGGNIGVGGNSAVGGVGQKWGRRQQWRVSTSKNRPSHNNKYKSPEQSELIQS